MILFFTIGANRGIANPEIISSFGPRTCWLHYKIPKWNFTIWAQVTYQQGKSQNRICPLRGHIFAFTLYLSMIDITDSYTYLLLIYLEDDVFETLCNFFLWHVSSFYSSHSKHAMPFQQQHSFYWLGNFMSICHQHWLALCHHQLTYERAHLFLLKLNDCQRLSVPRRQHSTLWRPQSLHQWFFPVSSCYTRSKAVWPSSEWKICSWTCTVASMKAIVSTAFSSRTWM